MKINFKRRALLGASVLSMALFGALSAHSADAWPSRHITLIVPFPAGDTTDILGRNLAKHLSKRLGQPVVVENKPGGGTLLGSRYVALAKPDGYTLMLTTSALTVMHHTRDDVKLNLATDFESIAVVGEPALVLAANPDVPAKNVTELIAWLKANPGKANFATYGVGSLYHLGAEMFSQQAGVEMNYIPYNGGAPAMNDLIAGHVQLMFNAFRMIGPMVKEGKLRAIASANMQRSTMYPDVPTVAESGVPGFSIGTWYALFAPKGTPTEIVGKLNGLTLEILALPEMQNLSQSMDLRVIASNQADTRKIVGDEMKKWRDFVAKTGIKVKQ